MQRVLSKPVYQTTWIQILEDSMLIVAALKNSKYLFFL